MASMKNVTLFSGPGKMDLMLALFDRPNGERLVEFTIEAGEKKSVFATQINSVSREDGSAESWLFEGWASVTEHDGNAKTIKGTAEVSGYWNTRSRRGWINITLPS